MSTLERRNKKQNCASAKNRLQRFAHGPLGRCTIEQNVPDCNLCENIKRNVPALFEY